MSLRVCIGAARKLTARGALLAGLLLAAGCAGPGLGTVAMLTDYGSRDHYVGVLCANVLRANPSARLVTITHEIEPYNIEQGAAVLADAVPEFAAGTVVIGVVDPGVGTQRAALVVVTHGGHMLVGPDNGLFDPLIQRDGGARAVYRIENPNLMRPGGGSTTFHGRDIFAPVAGHLSRGVAPAAVGPRVRSWVTLERPTPHAEGYTFSGAVIHVDRYGNLLTNMPAAWLEAVELGTVFRVRAGEQVVTCTYRLTYGEVAEGEFVVLRNASGNVEVARNRGSAAEVLEVREGAGIQIERVANGPRPP
jgi:S-adenosylmethionine hydrolase